MAKPVSPQEVEEFMARLSQMARDIGPDRRMVKPYNYICERDREAAAWALEEIQKMKRAKVAILAVLHG